MIQRRAGLHKKATKLGKKNSLRAEVQLIDGINVRRIFRRRWTDAQVALAEKCFRSDLARAITLGANTGQRISDLVRMCWTDIETFRGKDRDPHRSVGLLRDVAEGSST